MKKALKKKTLSTLFLALWTSLLLSAQAAPVTNLVQEKAFVPTLKFYVPLGFDSNDEVEVVLLGRIPNNCYESASSSFSVNQAEKKINIELSSRTRIRAGENCRNNPIDFLETVKLGVMDAGKYVVAVNEGTTYQQYNYLNIESATGPNIDSFNYANVEYIEVDNVNDMYYLVGTNPTGCMELDEIKMVSNKRDVLAILPIVKNVSGECENAPHKFKYPFALTDELTSETILLHVRSMNGKSVNKIVRNVL